MSLNISGSKYVRVYDLNIRLNFSDKVVFANLVTSRKTGKVKKDKDTGAVIVNPRTGEEVQERAYSHWEGMFVGNAFEPSKGLRDGDSIDIISGWITDEVSVGKDGKKYVNRFVTIADFTPSEIGEGEDTNVDDEI